MGTYTSSRLIREGLPVKWHIVKNSRFRVIDIDEFFKWAEENKSILDFPDSRNTVSEQSLTG